ncbi:hypothetical protein SNEBB_000340 [Seison nebaliae]|nr:hypothetical protein SNEBB_000340 [Seison nebaliae]
MKTTITPMQQNYFEDMMAAPIGLDQKLLILLLIENPNLVGRTVKILAKQETCTKFIKRIYLVKVLLEHFKERQSYREYRKVFYDLDRILAGSKFLKKETVKIWNSLQHIQANKQYSDPIYQEKVNRQFWTIVRKFTLPTYNGPEKHAVRIFLQTELFYFLVASLISKLHINEVIVRGNYDLEDLYKLNDENKLEMITKYYHIFQANSDLQTLYSRITLNTPSSYSIINELNEYYARHKHVQIREEKNDKES